jgi:hypothetical protein
VAGATGRAAQRPGVTPAVVNDSGIVVAVAQWQSTRVACGEALGSIPAGHLQQGPLNYDPIDREKQRPESDGRECVGAVLCVAVFVAFVLLVDWLTR